MTPNDLTRLEGKVDKLTDAVTHLVRIDERQAAHLISLNRLEAAFVVQEAKLEATEKLLSQWIQRGIGAWMLVGGAGTVVALVKYLPHA